MADLPSQIDELWSRASELGPADTEALAVVGNHDQGGVRFNFLLL